MIRLFVPGRLCLFGEHSDWAGGYRVVRPEVEPGLCITAGTHQGITATAGPCPGRFRAGSFVEGAPASLDVPYSAEALAPLAAEGGFWSYAAGTALAMLHDTGVDGIELASSMDLPLRKGLSSSAAICVCVARAFNQVHGLGLTTDAEMDLAYRGETLTPSRCGRMDQVCALGRTTNLLTFDGDTMRVEPIAVGGVFYLLIVDLGGAKDTVKILKSLNACFADRHDPIASGVRQALGSLNHEIAGSARAALEAGDASGLGSLMDRAQEAFDRLIAPACPDELTSPLLHRVLAYRSLRDLIHGGKGVGSQGDGCAQLVCRGQEERESVRRILQHKLGMASFDLTLG
ncbi:GHMP kinase [Candidatus Fermentibacteria bacterium]|nr:GHMP kinase [Candidatus Fermentibacteria bacterium]